MAHKKRRNTFYITTAIDYSNSLPHLGHAFEKIGADVTARFHRFLGKEVFYLLGTDEHSQNVKRLAENAGIAPKTYCDQMAEKFKRVWNTLNISYSRFIQTSDPVHHDAVSEILERIHKKGDIYKGIYEGDYCPSCERFLDTSEDVNEDGHCKVHSIALEHVKEENYFFRLKKYQEPLLNHIKKHRTFIQPETRRNEILGLIQKGFEDISISRQSTDWGIPLPFDPKSVAYVWVDALINYISGLGGLHHQDYERFWPPDLHVIGKDITRFHCVIWPAMLMSADIPLPEKIWGHGFVHSKGVKMSKTRGTGVNPIELSNAYGADSLRYFLMREIPWDKDGEFHVNRLIERHNSELSNGIGNLVSRIHSMVNKYFAGEIKDESSSDASILTGNIVKKVDIFIETLLKLELNQGLEIVNEMIREINVFIDHNKPWAMAKNTQQRQELSALIHEAVVCTLVTCLCLSPFCPQKMEAVFDSFSLDFKEFSSRDSLNRLFEMKSFRAKTPFSSIFPRIEHQDSLTP